MYIMMPSGGQVCCCWRRFMIQTPANKLDESGQSRARAPALLGPPPVAPILRRPFGGAVRRLHWAPPPRGRQDACINHATRAHSRPARSATFGIFFAGAQAPPCYLVGEEFALAAGSNKGRRAIMTRITRIRGRARGLQVASTGCSQTRVRRGLGPRGARAWLQLDKAGRALHNSRVGRPISGAPDDRVAPAGRPGRPASGA